MEINFQANSLSKEDLHKLRMQLYHSTGDGFCIFRSFIPGRIASHISNFWTVHVDPKITHSVYLREDINLNLGHRYLQDNSGNISFFNPLWAKSLDIVSNEIALSIIALRARIEGKALSRDIYPLVGSRCVIPRIVVTRNGENVVPEHSDYGLDEPNIEDIDLSRLQATLVLSEHCKDYSGDGLYFYKNSGEKVFLAQKNSLKAGDLLVWRYVNKHGVSNVSSDSQQLGFVRMLFPYELIREAGNFRLSAKKFKQVMPQPIKQFVKKILGR